MLCEHNWETSPLLAYMATEYDGPNYRTLRLEVCARCGVLRAPNHAKWAGHSTRDAAIAVAVRPPEGEKGTR